MESIILLLTLAFIFYVFFLYKIQRKEYVILLQYTRNLEKDNQKISDELRFQKSLTKTFEAGYDNIKKQQQKQIIN